jgi:hypothetical protein
MDRARTWGAVKCASSKSNHTCCTRDTPGRAAAVPQVVGCTQSTEAHCQPGLHACMQVVGHKGQSTLITRSCMTALTLLCALAHRDPVHDGGVQLELALRDVKDVAVNRACAQGVVVVVGGGVGVGAQRNMWMCVCTVAGWVVWGWLGVRVRMGQEQQNGRRATQGRAKAVPCKCIQPTTTAAAFNRQPFMRLVAGAAVYV